MSNATPEDAFGPVDPETVDAFQMIQDAGGEPLRLNGVGLRTRVEPMMGITQRFLILVLTGEDGTAYTVELQPSVEVTPPEPEPEPEPEG